MRRWCYADAWRAGQPETAESSVGRASVLRSWAARARGGGTFVAVFVRRLREGKTYEDFLKAWYPDRGFGFAGRGPITARSLDDEREILTVGFVDLPSREKLSDAMARLAHQEAVRHDRLDEVIESTVLRAIYEQLDEFDFSTDESVAAGRP